MVVVHGHEDGSCVSGCEQGGDGLEETERQAPLLNVALPGPHQFFSQRLLQGQRELAGGWTMPSGVDV